MERRGETVREGGQERGLIMKGDGKGGEQEGWER